MSEIWIIPEDTILTYFQLRHWDELKKTNAPDGYYNARQYVTRALWELLTPQARIAFGQVGSTNFVKLGFSNMREVIMAALPNHIDDPFSEAV